MYPAFGDMYVFFPPLSLVNNCDWLYLENYTETTQTDTKKNYLKVDFDNLFSGSRVFEVEVVFAV